MARVAVSGRAASTRNNSVLYNGNFEVKPSVITAATTTAGRWIDGTAAGNAARTSYGWATPSAGSGVGANGEIGFDTTVFRSGVASLRLSNLTITGGVTATTVKNVTPATSSAFELFPLMSGSVYTLAGHIRTNNVPTNGAFIDIRQYGSTFTNLATTSTTKLGGTDANWREVTLTFTSNASAVWGALLLRNTTTGNICDAWFDDITLVPATTGRVAASGRVTP